MNELLCPAGSTRALEAAVYSGADAVYFGGSVGNARMSAANFDNEEIIQAIKFCRLYGVKSYITVNTVTSDCEIPEVMDFIEHINDAGADGVILQSPGLARLVKACAPDMEIHASTQLSVHSSYGAKAAYDMGFSRIVPARELNAENIKKIINASPAEVEIFIHGALCMCYSGQCYLSSMIGSRSGNRGSCAQPCRQMYKNGYELSLKDLCLAHCFKDVLALGAASFKIEGRLKSPEYVSGVTKIYRKLIDENRNATEDEIKFLADLFSRQGFTDGYFKNEKGKKMFGYRTSENKSATRLLEIQIPEKKINTHIEYSVLKPTATDGEVTLTASANGKSVYACENLAQNAKSAETTASDIEKQLSKTGGTHFCAEVSGNVPNGIFIPVSRLNGLRRSLIEKLENTLCELPERSFTPPPKTVRGKKTSGEKHFNFYFHTAEQAELAKDYFKYAKNIWLTPEAFKDACVKDAGVIIPRINTDNEMFCEKLKNLGAKKALCGTLDAVYMCLQLGIEPHGGYSLNIYNSEDIKFYKKLGVSSLCVSPELGIKSIKDLSSGVPLTAVVYGYLPAMITENCVIKNANKCGSRYFLKDKTGAAFEVLCAPNHRNIVLNSVPIMLSDRLDEFESAGICGFDLMFMREADPRPIIEAYLNAEKPSGKYTRGLYYRM